MTAQQSALTRLLDWAAGQVATIRSSHVNQHTGQIDDEEIREEVEQVEDDMKALDGLEERIRKLECDLGSTLVRAESAEQKLAEMREENRGLRQDTLTLERRGDRLEAALQIVDRHMSGNDSYEGIWVNYPDKPEQSPAAIVRELFSDGSGGEWCPSCGGQGCEDCQNDASTDGIITRCGGLGMQVCVPKDWTDRQVVDFANRANPCGTENGWSIRRTGDRALAGADERVTCGHDSSRVHIMLDA